MIGTFAIRIRTSKGYHDGAQGQLPRYLLGDEEEVLVQKTSVIPAEASTILADAPNVVAGANVGEGGTEPDSQDSS